MAVKYVFVTGGVVSGLGKGITAASLGRLLKARAVVVVESMAAITILDLLFTNMSARMDKLKSFYGTDVVALF